MLGTVANSIDFADETVDGKEDGVSTQSSNDRFAASQTQRVNDFVVLHLGNTTIAIIVWIFWWWWKGVGCGELKVCA